jgi:hypothetical protein
MKFVARSMFVSLVCLTLACSRPEWSGPAEQKAATAPADDKIVAPADKAGPERGPSDEAGHD